MSALLLILDQIGDHFSLSCDVRKVVYIMCLNLYTANKGQVIKPRYYHNKQIKLISGDDRMNTVHRSYCMRLHHAISQFARIWSTPFADDISTTLFPPPPTTWSTVVVQQWSRSQHGRFNNNDPMTRECYDLSYGWNYSKSNPIRFLILY